MARELSDAPASTPVVPSAEEHSTDDVDPNGFADAWAQLGGASRRTGSAAALVTSALLADEGDVETVLVGRFRGENAVMTLTRGVLFIVNAREWAPEIVVVSDISQFQVEGWIDRRLATIRLSRLDEVYVVDKIADTAMAEGMTSSLRSR
jgi:hypothetical protein